MKNVIGIKFMHTDQYGRRRTYHFRNDTGFKVSKGDQVIVLNHQGKEEIVEVYRLLKPDDEIIVSGNNNSN